MPHFRPINSTDSGYFINFKCAICNIWVGLNSSDICNSVEIRPIHYMTVSDNVTYKCVAQMPHFRTINSTYRGYLIN